MRHFRIMQHQINMNKCFQQIKADDHQTLSVDASRGLKYRYTVRISWLIIYKVF